MASDEFDKVEQPALNQLQALGWIYITDLDFNPDTSSERTSFKDVVLETRLFSSIKRINPWISEENLSKVVRDLTKTQYINLLEANEAIWNILTDYISVIQDLGQGNKNQTVKIIDFDNIQNNDFVCTNQFKVSGPVQNIIPDIVLFVNGLPLAVIECKSPCITNPMEAGIDQLLRYANRRHPEDMEGAEKLFHYNQVMVSTHKDKATVGTITSRMEHFLEWKDPYPIKLDDQIPEGSQEILLAGVFAPTNFLDIIQNFTTFEPTDGRIIKKIPRYQQYRAVHKTIERLNSGKSRKEKSGVIWHTQGSGKSLTMVFLAIKLRRDPLLKDYKLVFLTDRTQLDGQLTRTFRRTQKETIHQAQSVNDLKELLAKDASDIITATVQKFQDSVNGFDFPVLNESEKIIVLADEAHRTQYGTLGMAINAGLPNAPKIAFTGTPLIKSQKTNTEFGSYIDTYTIEEAVNDGATVQILYEGREAKVKVTGDSLDNLFDEYFSDKTDEEKELIKKKFGTERAILEAPKRIHWVCIDILRHYREHIEPNGFKAMIVTSSRHAAIAYKEQLEKLDYFNAAVIISSDHNDDKRIREYTDAVKQKQQIEDFKKPLGSGDNQSNLSILIVKDMLLTGFDAPIVQVMYLDRKLTDHNLLQAIARVNRTNKNKFRGYIVDYYGLSDYLTSALDMFTKEDVKGALINIKEEVAHLKNAHSRVMQHFKGLDLNDLETCVLSLSDEDQRQTFQTDFQKFARQMDIILPDATALPFLGDLKLLGKISLGARNLYRDSQLNISGVGEKVRQLIEDHIYATGVDPKIPPVDLLSVDFENKLNEHKSSKAKASEVQHAIKHHINVNLEEDPEYYKKLSERLDEIIKKSGEKWADLLQMLLDFRANIEPEHQKKAQDLGLSSTEFAFHNILMAGIAKKYGDPIPEDLHDQVIELVKKLVLMIQEATAIVGFFEKWNEVQRVQKEIRRTILAQDFGSVELVKDVTDGFMELAKVKFK